MPKPTVRSERAEGSGIVIMDADNESTLILARLLKSPPMRRVLKARFAVAVPLRLSDPTLKDQLPVL